MEKEAEPKAAAGDAILSSQEAADLLMVSFAWLRKLVKDGWIAEASKGKYRLADVVQGHIRFVKDDDRRSTKSSSASAAQQARAEEIKVRTDERTGRLLREAQTEAIDVLAEFAGALMADLHAIPARFTMDLKQRAKLAQDIDRAFADASKRAASAANLVVDARSRLEAAGKRRTKAVGRGKPKVSGKHRAPRPAKP